MGREVRRVPPDWEHPKTMQEYWPMHDRSLREAQEEWDADKAKWDAGEDDHRFKLYTEEDLERNREHYKNSEENVDDWCVVGEPIWTFESYYGLRPPYYDNEDYKGVQEDNAYRPEWPEESRTAYQIYETVSEGTPISPVFETTEAMVDWLCDPKRDADPYRSMSLLSREAAEKFVEYGYAPSMMISGGVMAMNAEAYEPGFLPEES